MKNREIENARFYIKGIFGRAFGLDDRELRINISDSPSVTVRYRDKEVKFSKNLIDSKLEQQIIEKLKTLL